MSISAHQAKYYAHELSSSQDGDGVERLSQSLFDAKVELKPHQIDAALFALKYPLREGVLLADEVGLGKTIEAGLVLCQLWAERKRNILIVCPASLRKQWVQELADKFALPAQVIDQTIIQKSRLSLPVLLAQNSGRYIMVMSYPFAAKQADTLLAHTWDWVVMDEAHKLRNAHRKNNRTGQALKQAFAGRKKMLLTATPLQNSLMELYGLSTLLDEHLFGDEKEFRRQFIQKNDTEALRGRMNGFVQRTLRRDVLEYINYTRRHTLTQRFTPSDNEHALYEAISAFLQKEESYALPARQRHLTGLILRRLLASSPQAVAGTLEVMRTRLMEMQKTQQNNIVADLLAEDDFSSDYQDWEESESDDDALAAASIKTELLTEEIGSLSDFIAAAKTLDINSKAQALLEALDKGFERMRDLGAAQKALIFTESVRTQQQLLHFLEAHGYQNRVVLFSGSNIGEQATIIYQQWLNKHGNSDIVTGSPSIDRRTALIEHFRDHAQIMIATEAAAEGVNMQFCSLLINYDLPWNPQRIEQRIGRCHRYGQKFDVVVINFLNSRNQADQRVLELLTDKFRLFDGIFGASDEVLGKIESGLDFEKRIAAIYDTCRTSEAIQTAFDKLQQELEDEIQARLEQTQKQLLDAFDEDVHERLKTRLEDTHSRLDKISRWFWGATRFALAGRADFNYHDHCFYLKQSPVANVAIGTYFLKNHRQQPLSDGHLHRLGQPLGTWCITQGLNADTPPAVLCFDYSRYANKVSTLAAHLGKSGWLRLDKLSLVSEAHTHETLLFTARTDTGEWLDDDFCQKIMMLDAQSQPATMPIPEDLADNAAQRLQAEIARLTEANQTALAHESERLEQWANDKIKAAEHAINETSELINQAKRQRRQAPNLQEQVHWEHKIKELEQKRRRQRQQIFDVEDEITAQRDALIDAMNARLRQQSKADTLWVVRWQIK